MLSNATFNLYSRIIESNVIERYLTLNSHVVEMLPKIEFKYLRCGGVYGERDESINQQSNYLTTFTCVHISITVTITVQ